MVLRNGKKKNCYRVESLPENYLLKVLGVRTGMDLIVQSKQPFGGPIVVKLGNRSIAIDSNLAGEILVKEVV